MTTLGSKEVIPLFNKLSAAVQFKIPMLLAMIQMTPEEVAVLERLLARCQERSVSCEEIWKDGESEEQRILRELIKEVHIGR